MTVPIWKIWDQDQTDEPVQKVDKRQIKETRQKNIKQQESQPKWKLLGVRNQPVELQSRSKGKHMYKLLLMILKRLYGNEQCIIRQCFQ